MLKPSLVEEQQQYYLTHTWEDKGIHIFPKGISLRENIIIQVKFELSYFETHSPAL